MRWLGIKSGVERAAFAPETCKAKLYNRLWLGQTDHIQDFGLEPGSSLSHHLPSALQHEGYAVWLPSVSIALPGFYSI